jgi:hypothetical protein
MAARGVELLSVTFRCQECGMETSTPWARFAQTMWTEVQSCECCGTSTTTRGDLTCSGCGTVFEVNVHGA